jgi:hypothetical protein
VPRPPPRSSAWIEPCPRAAFWGPFALDNNAKILGKSILHQTLPLTKTAADELPPPDTKRWVPRRKAVVVEAVLSGVITLEEVCRRYALSVDEFLSWHNAMEMHGVPGLRTTRLQIYRDSSHRSAGTAPERLPRPDVNIHPEQCQDSAVRSLKCAPGYTDYSFSDRLAAA